MELKEEKGVLLEMIDLCQELCFGPLNIACESLYKDIQEASTLEELLSLSSEILMHADEVPYRDEDSMGILGEISDLHNKLQEMAE